MLKANILVIDDEPDIRDTLALMLSEEGYQVRTACDGADGLKKISSQAPDLILLDMNMPKMGGIVFYHNIANTYDGSPKYPVIVLTARGDLENLFNDFKIDAFITKPFDFDELMNTIHTVLLKSKSERSQSIETPKKIKEKSALIVEDQDGFFDEMVILFLNQGYKLKKSETSRSILQHVRYDKPDAVFIRIKTEKKECFETVLAEAIRDIEVAKETPIIFYPPQNLVVSDSFCDYLKNFLPKTFVAPRGGANQLLKIFEENLVK